MRPTNPTAVHADPFARAGRGASPIMERHR